MANRVCPWWLGYFLASPLRRWMQDPTEILSPHVHRGMTVLEPGPGMGFFTIPLARLVGSSGRVVAVDLQEQMIAGLKRRAAKANVLERIDARLSRAESMGLGDLEGSVDFTLAFAMVHEFPDAARFFREVARASKPGAQLLLAEPRGHVDDAKFTAELSAAAAAGFELSSRPVIRRSHGALLTKSM
jgi:ubiquinone/menaquinone biosynthesis C-methylase UbiE